VRSDPANGSSRSKYIEDRTGGQILRLYQENELYLPTSAPPSPWVPRYRRRNCSPPLRVRIG